MLSTEEESKTCLIMGRSGKRADISYGIELNVLGREWTRGSTFKGLAEESKGGLLVSDVWLVD